MEQMIQNKQQNLNRRQLYKNQKLQQIDQIYYCQCGKNYLTFSALYLHARNKHNVKLTTKRNSTNCKVQNLNEKTIVTYFISVNQIELIQQNDIKLENQNTTIKNKQYGKIIEILQEYINQNNSQKQYKNNYKNIIIQQFINYFQQIQYLKEQNYPIDVDSITLYFNDFIINYLPDCHAKRKINLNAFLQSENQLIYLWRWLKKYNYTSTNLLHKTYPSSYYGF